MYQLKKAVLEGDFTQADSYEDEIEDLMEMEGYRWENIIMRYSDGHKAQDRMR